MNKTRVKATIAAAVALAGLLAGAGVVYAATTGPDSCGPVPSLSKATGPNDSTSTGTNTSPTDGPLCVAPAVPVVPVGH
jgi:hypothetical protein